MKKGLMILLIALCSLALFANGQNEAPAQVAAEPAKAAFPTGPITLVCPWNAGAGADLVCRNFEKMGNDYFGVPIVVENQNGAAGVTATVNFLKAKADGYSVLFDNVGVFTSKSLTGAAKYTIDDYEPLTGIVKEINVLLVNTKNTGVKNFEDFLKAYSGTDKSLTIGCATAGIPHLCMAQLFMQANVKYKQVAYNGGAEIIAALLGGHIDVACISTSEAAKLLESPDIAVVGIFNSERVKTSGFENVPSFFEFGYNIDTAVRRILLVPKGTPKEVYDVLYKGFTGMIQDPRFIEFANQTGVVLDMLSPEDVTKTVKDELEAIRPIFQELKLGIYAEKKK